MSSISSADGGIDDLRKSLLKLKPDGEDGLEGLVAHALASFMGKQFRVARAGRQHGRDGATTPGTFDVFFETKLYTDRAPRTEDLQAKLLSALMDHQPNLDVWVIACTTALGDTPVKELIETGENSGITVVVLDWSHHPLPALAVLFASEREAVFEWLRHNSNDLRLTVEPLLDAVAAHPSYAASRSELVELLSPATAGWGAARARNNAWLKAHLKNRAKARQVFGQFIAPDDPDFAAVPRKTLAARVAHAMSGPNPCIVAAIGDEGTGKTWLTTMAWESLADRPICLLCTTDNAPTDATLRDPLRFLAHLLIDQTGDTRTNNALDRWLRRLECWGKRPSNGIRIWLVLDGLNERESCPWSIVTDGLMNLPEGLGLRVLLTSRPAFFRERVLPRLANYSTPQISVEPFTEGEVSEALQKRGVDPDTVEQTVQDFLRNPRVFSIAVSMLDRVKPDELTRERLLFEYRRKRFEERRGLRHSDADMRRLLISHAEAARKQLRQSPTPAAISFRRDLWKEHSGLAQRITDPSIDDELSEVESGRFFEPDPDTEGNYRIRAEGFAYALGLLVIDEARSASKDDMLATIDAALDPIRGLDLLAEVLLAAFGIACIDTRCTDALAAALLYSFLGVQNSPESSTATILAYSAARPTAFIEATELHWCGVGHNRKRTELLTSILLRRRCDPKLGAALDIAIHRWLTL